MYVGGVNMLIGFVYFVVTTIDNICKAFSTNYVVNTNSAVGIMVFGVLFIALLLINRDAKE
jgi:hypothetical protein